MTKAKAFTYWYKLGRRWMATPGFQWSDDIAKLEGQGQQVPDLRDDATMRVLRSECRNGTPRQRSLVDSVHYNSTLDAYATHGRDGPRITGQTMREVWVGIMEQHDDE